MNEWLIGGLGAHVQESKYILAKHGRPSFKMVLSNFDPSVKSNEANAVALRENLHSMGVQCVGYKVEYFGNTEVSADSVRFEALLTQVGLPALLSSPLPSWMNRSALGDLMGDCG